MTPQPKILEPFNKLGISFKNVIIGESTTLSSRFKEQTRLLYKKGKKPKKKIMYHLTDLKSANKIMNEGFKVSHSYYKAFGRGVNLCPELEKVLKYRKMRSSTSGEVAVIVAEVLIGRAHANTSCMDTVIKESNGAQYSRPKYLRPRSGYDCMYSANPSKEIWIFPNGYRVLPIATVVLKERS